jgi:hypothetical protein
MGDHHHRHLAAGVTVPAVGEVVEPAADHGRAGLGYRPGQQVGRRLRDVQLGEPLAQLHRHVPALVEAEQLVAAVVRVGDEAVQRHRQVCDYLAHGVPPLVRR